MSVWARGWTVFGDFCFQMRAAHLLDASAMYLAISLERPLVELVRDEFIGAPHPFFPGSIAAPLLALRFLRLQKRAARASTHFEDFICTYRWYH